MQCGPYWSKSCTPSLHFTALNTGVRLWVQQFWAMVVKRALNTFRHFGIIVSQLILPMVFVLLGLVFLKTLPSRLANDPPRPLTLKESSPYTGIKMFYGDFGDVRAHQLLEVRKYVKSVLHCMYILHNTEFYILFNFEARYSRCNGSYTHIKLFLR